MDHPSNTDPELLRQLIEEMDKAIAHLSGGTVSVRPPQGDLKTQIEQMAMTITDLSKEMYIRCVVGSVFDTQSVQDTLDELRYLNEKGLVV